MTKFFLLNEPPETGPSLVPEGLYPLQIVEAEPRVSLSRQGEGRGYFWFALEIIFPSVEAGRTLFTSYHMVAPLAKLGLPTELEKLPDCIGRQFVGKVTQKFVTIHFGLHGGQWKNNLELRYEI